MKKIEAVGTSNQVHRDKIQQIEDEIKQLRIGLESKESIIGILKDLSKYR